MPNIIRFLAVLIAFVALSPHSYSQTVGKVLEGITSVQVRVNDLNEAARACPITRNDLFESAAFTIAASRLSLDATSSVVLRFKVLVVGIAMGRADPICFADYSVRASTEQIVELDETNLNRRVTIDLWHDSGLRWAPWGDFETILLDTIRRTTKAFIADWTLDQQ